MADDAKSADVLPTISNDRSTGYSAILDEHNIQKHQRNSRVRLLEEIGDPRFHDNLSPNAVVAHIANDALAGNDVAILGNVLLSLGDLNVLDLIIHSPGGDGTAVEKIVALCRAQCRRFRVIIPEDAKSAATMIALGADEIVMGPPSEIGPIDAQIPVVANGIFRFLSAQSFIDAKANLLKQYGDFVSSGQDPKPVLQMIATLDMPFIEQCEKMMDFGRDVVRKLLSDHMFKSAKDKSQKIDTVVRTLSSVDRFKVHGRRIDGNTARRELGLKVKLLGKDDPFWQKIWEYYTRAQIALGTARAAKMFETKSDMLVAQPQ